MELDVSGWSGEGDFTKRLIDAIDTLGAVRMLKVEDAPASRGDSAFSFISNELFVLFAAHETIVRRWKFGIIPVSERLTGPGMTLASLEAALTARENVGEPDYSDEGMLQYLKVERIIPPYQTRGYKLVELVRLYEAGSAPRRDA